MNSYTLGLDIGSKSIGWTLINNKPCSILDIGVRVFPEGVDRDTKGAEKSKNATRREARGARRTHRRRNHRRNKLVKILRAIEFLPDNRQELKKLLEKEPYQLRAKGLDEKLELYDFGRVLFHLNQRRGFKSNRRTGKVKDDNKIAKAAGELEQKIEQAGCRTLGEYFAHINPQEKRIRAQYTFRSMYEKEFDELWKKQAEFYPDILTEELRRNVRDETIFYQRPLKPADHLIGDCDLEPGEKRCPRADWYARRFRIFQDINNLKIHNTDGTTSDLDENQKRKIFEQLSKAKEVKFDKLRKMLELSENQEFNAEYEINTKGKKKDKLKGDVFGASMQSKKIFGPVVWGSMNESKKIKLNDWLIELEDDELIERLAAEYKLNEEQVKSVLKIQLPQQYMRFSRKAIQKLLPIMQKGKRTDEALAEIYPDRNRNDIEEKGKLDLPEDLRNPIVNKALFEVRKVVNAIIREYGKPAKIKIEMARDVKGNLRQRQELQFKMWENEKRNNEAKKRLTDDIGIRNPSRDDIIKYNLWEESDHSCVYTGRHISQSALFSKNSEFQIEHILPYDRSLDDSYMNKTLCEVNENIHVKGNKTPYEAYNNEPEKYEQIKQRVKILPWPKRHKFLQKEINLDDSIRRELNDTRYICREAIKYLKQICSNVSGTRGKVTAELRHQWGLNNILDLSGSEIKNRDDHRHHSIDAAVVAVTKNEHLRKLAKSKYSQTAGGFELPWPDFRQELEEKVKHINVSHRATKKVSGQLHEDTSYGITGMKDEKGQDIFVYRKKLEDLTVSMVNKIVDPVVRQIVKQRLMEFGIDLEKNQKIGKEVWLQPLYMKTTRSDKKVPIKKVRIIDVFNNMILLNDTSGKPYRAVTSGNNHHIEILEYTGKKGRTKWEGEVVTMFEAVRRNQNGEPVIKRDHGPDKKFVCSLSINEMFMLQIEEGNGELHRVQKITQSGNNISIIFRPHTYAGKVSDYDKPPLIQRRSPNTLKGHKVTVDMLGRVHMAND